MATALGRHLVLVGFMGAGKSALGREVARRLDRPFLDVDEEVERAHGPIWELFEREGEAAFRELEARFLREAATRRDPAVIAVGGGAVETRELLPSVGALVVHLEVDVETAWARVQGSRRPLARDEAAFRERYERRRPLYAEAADAAASDVEGIILAAGGVSISGEITAKPVEVVADERVLELHAPPVGGPVRTVPAGESAKTMQTAERLWRELRLDRSGTLVAFGGGSTTDVAGFVAATYLRGIDWVAVPTTLVGQVDAAIGGKTAINLPEAKNLVGAFHYPESVVLDSRYLTTLPEDERRQGMAEVVKTGLLAGEPFWQFPEQDMVRACAAFKAAVCLSDPFETTGRRTILNLGHTFAHGLEAASGYTLAHGDAVALGLVAALRLSGQPADVVEQVLPAEPARVDPDAAWAAMRLDKKGEGVFVLLEKPGRPVVTSVPKAEARRALESVVRK